MITTRLHLLRLFPFLWGGHRQLALENLALRHQLTVYKRTVNRPTLRRSDRLFWVALSRVWVGWRAALMIVIVTPDTVLRWQQRRLRQHWTKLSGRPMVGRPPSVRAAKDLRHPELGLRGLERWSPCPILNGLALLAPVFLGRTPRLDAFEAHRDVAGAGRRLDATPRLRSRRHPTCAR